MNHKWVEHRDCLINGCPICDGGLDVCSVCGLVEGSLTTDCPGVPCWTEKNRLIYDGIIDFKDGEWVYGVSHYSPQGH